VEVTLTHMTRGGDSHTHDNRRRVVEVTLTKALPGIVSLPSFLSLPHAL